MGSNKLIKFWEKNIELHEIKTVKSNKRTSDKTRYFASLILCKRQKSLGWVDKKGLLIWKQIKKSKKNGFLYSAINQQKNRLRM